MIPRRAIVLVVWGAAALVRSPAASSQPAAPAVADESVAATVDGEPILRSELERAIALDLLRLRQAEYDAQLAGIRRLAAAKLEEREAHRRGVSVAELIRGEVDAKAGAPSASELDAVAGFIAPQSGETPAAARTRVTTMLTLQRRQKRRSDFDGELLAKARIDLAIDPPRYPLARDLGWPSSGPAGTSWPTMGEPSAAVTVVELADFECTGCAAARPFVRDVVAQHPGKVRVVYVTHPLSVHGTAHEAAEAALCAADQGRFWELHDWLYDHQSSTGREAILASAGGLGIDAGALGGCLDAAAHVKDVDRGVDLAHALGSESTPAYFVNGRAVLGAPSNGALEDAVRQEIARLASASKPPAGAPSKAGVPSPG